VILQRLSLIAAAATTFATAFAPTVQPPATIDFQRDVQPIFREHCISCHGPDQQVSGLRLDRRADAMRGGSQADIGPGNAQGSRLYHRLIGTAFGLRMPPAGPLSTEQTEIIKQWIDEGAEWPDAASGETPAPMSTRDRTTGAQRSSSPAASSAPRRRCDCCSTTVRTRRSGMRQTSRRCAKRRASMTPGCFACCWRTAPA
jgi:mono/diheme cytochrome c family protein